MVSFPVGSGRLGRRFYDIVDYCASRVPPRKAGVIYFILIVNHYCDVLTRLLSIEPLGTMMLGTDRYRAVWCCLVFCYIALMGIKLLASDVKKVSSS